MHREDQPLIVGIGGTTRADSSTERALVISLAAARGKGFRTEIICGADLDMPMYSPLVAERSASARRMVDLFRRCDGLIIASPSYHGGVSGLIKNALDYTEDLRADERVYLEGCPIGLIAGGAGWQGAVQALNGLRAIAHALRGWPTPLGAVLNTLQPNFDASGRCIDAAALFQLEMVGQQVANFLAQRIPAECAPA